MADGGLSKFISYLFNLVRYDNGSASNAISVQISKPLGKIVSAYRLVSARIYRDYKSRGMIFHPQAFANGICLKCISKVNTLKSLMKLEEKTDKVKFLG